MSRSAPIRVLLVEDSPVDAELELRELKRAGLRIVHRVVATEGDYRRALEEFRPDVIISDFTMPGFDGMAALAIAREYGPDIPFIFVSGTLGEEYAIRALKNGATDYVLKSNLVRLPPAVERALEDTRVRLARRQAERALAAAQERLEDILHSLRDVLWSAEAPSFRPLYLSPAATEVFGRPPEAILRQRELWQDLVHRDDREIIASARQALLEKGLWEGEFRIVRPDGRVRWVNTRARLVRDPGVRAVRADGVTRDVTDLIEERERAARLVRLRELMSKVNAVLVRLRDRRSLLEEVCRVAVEETRLSVALAGLLDPDTQALVWQAAHGIPWDRVQGWRVSARADAEGGNGVAAVMLRSGEPQIVNDIAADERVLYRDQLLALGTRALACFPLKTEAKTVGMLALHAREPGYFDEEEIRLLRELAANLSFVLELIEKEERLNYLALRDPLSGLPNRHLFRDRLAQAIATARSAGGQLALIVLKLDRIGTINDALGRHVGDQLLRQFAERLRGAMGSEGQVGHFGGDRFAAMQPVSGVADGARVLSRAERQLFGPPFQVEGRELKLAAHAGVAVFPSDGADADALLHNAEATVNRAREGGVRLLFYAPQINAQVIERIELEGRLRRALEAKEFVLHFQPQVEIAGRKIVGAEALIRWNDPQLGLIAPAKFVPVLEETGLILAAGRWLAAEALATYREWKKRGLAPPRISVNVSALELRHPDFVERFRALLEALPPEERGLDIEITESVLMENIAASIEKLRALRALGVGIALDDFGTGYSSLAYLSRLPIDSIKIDRSFVVDMTDAAESATIVSAVIALAQSLQLKVVAEGVETEEQARMLQRLRCDQMQGYLFSPPLPPDRFEALLAAGGAKAR